MIFYKKNFLTPRTKSKTFVFDDFSGGMCDKTEGDVSATYAQTCFNLDGSFGVLKQNFGFDKTDAASSVARDLRYINCFLMDGQEMMAAVDGQNNFVVLSLDNPTDCQTLLTTSGSAKLLPYRQNHKTSILIFDDNGLHIWDGAEVIDVTDVPVFDDVALYFERVFAIDKKDSTKLLFCQQLNPQEWTEGFDKGGYIVFDDNFGQLQKVLSFDSKLYVFGKNKIAQVTATSSPSEFFVSKIFTLNGDIVKKTIEVCGDVIMFLATDGLYRFDGSTVAKVASNMDKHFLQSGCETSCFFDTHYYLACKMDFFDGRKIHCERENFCNNVLLKVDVRQGKVSVGRGVDITSLAHSKNKLFFVTHGTLGQVTDSGMFFGVPLAKGWDTSYGDFGILSKKVIKSLCIYTLTDMTVKIFADGNLHVIRVCGKTYMQKIKVGITGDRFKICFEANFQKPVVIKPFFQIEYTGG